MGLIELHLLVVEEEGAVLDGGLDDAPLRLCVAGDSVAVSCVFGSVDVPVEVGAKRFDVADQSVIRAGGAEGFAVSAVDYELIPWVFVLGGLPVQSTS